MILGTDMNSPSASDVSMTESLGELIPLGSQGEYLELPSFSQMLTNIKIPMGSMDDAKTFSSADLNITSSEAVSMGQILQSLSSTESEGEIGIGYKREKQASPFGSVLSSE